jgi:hypothetical protein
MVRVLINCGTEKKKLTVKQPSEAERQWLMTAVLATWEAEIGRILVRGQPR